MQRAARHVSCHAFRHVFYLLQHGDKGCGNPPFTATYALLNKAAPCLHHRMPNRIAHPFTATALRERNPLRLLQTHVSQSLDA
mgnify:FL=1